MHQEGVGEEVKEILNEDTTQSSKKNLRLNYKKAKIIHCLICSFCVKKHNTMAGTSVSSRAIVLCEIITYIFSVLASMESPNISVQNARVTCVLNAVRVGIGIARQRSFNDP